jgi:hypothetical protein
MNTLKTYFHELKKKKSIILEDKKLTKEQSKDIVEKLGNRINEVSMDKVHQLTKAGLFNIDNLCYDLLGIEGHEANSTFSRGQWENWQNVSASAKVGNMAMDSAGNNFIDPMIADKITSIMTPKFLGYGTLAYLEPSPWVRKILHFKADNLYGKGIALTGDGSRECNRKIQNILSAWDDVNLDEEIITLARWTYLFGGADMAVGIKGVKGEALQRPLKYNDLYIPKNSIMQFQSVCPYLSSPMIPNNVNAFAPFFYQVEHRMVINRLTHVSRLISMDTCKPNQLIAPQYQYRGVSLIQEVIKYLFQIITSSNATAQAMIQNALWIYETSLNYLADEQFQNELKSLQASRDNTMFVPIRLQDKIYIVQIDLSSNAEIIRTWLDMLSMLVGAPQTIFVGSAAKGLNATGDQEMKNFHDSIDAERRKTRYNSAIKKAINHLQCHCNGEIDPRIKMTNVELDESYDRKRAEITQLATDSGEKLLLNGVLSPEEWRNAIGHQKWHIYNTIVQEQVDQVDALENADIAEQQYIPLNELNNMSNLGQTNLTDSDID